MICPRFHSWQVMLPVFNPRAAWLCTLIPSVKYLLCTWPLHIYYFFHSLQSSEVGDMISIWQMKKLRLREKEWQYQSSDSGEAGYKAGALPHCSTLSKEPALGELLGHLGRGSQFYSSSSLFVLPIRMPWKILFKERVW